MHGFESSASGSPEPEASLTPRVTHTRDDGRHDANAYGGVIDKVDWQEHPGDSEVAYVGFIDDHQPVSSADEQLDADILDLAEVKRKPVTVAIERVLKTLQLTHKDLGYDSLASLTDDFVVRLESLVMADTVVDGAFMDRLKDLIQPVVSAMGSIRMHTWAMLLRVRRGVPASEPSTVLSTGDGALRIEQIGGIPSTEVSRVLEAMRIQLFSGPIQNGLMPTADAKIIGETIVGMESEKIE